ALQGKGQIGIVIGARLDPMTADHMRVVYCRIARFWPKTPDMYLTNR
ncbi:MAG: hypothetical protein ACJASZ_001900, partial [Yoonia sp.]